MYESVILGAGPAGTGALVHAAKAGLLRDWLDRGLALVEAGDQMGGAIGQYSLNADTIAGTFLECLEGGDPESPLLRLRAATVTRLLQSNRAGLPPLPVVGRFMRQLGETLADTMACHRRSRFMPRTRVRSVHLHRDGGVRVELLVGGGRLEWLRAGSAVMALGGRPIDGLSSIPLDGELTLSRWMGKLLPANALLRQGGAVLAQRAVRGGEARVVVLGGSHSALSAAWLLLERFRLPIPAGGLHILHRATPRLFYPSRADAQADGYPFAEADVCPATGRVNRLGGLRGDGRDLCRRLLGVGGGAVERRAVIRPLASLPRAELISLLDRADLVVPAFGYRMATVPIFGPDGRLVPLARSGPVVDADCRLRLLDGGVLPNVLGVGLGSGFRPWGELAGEASFQGQQNSLWLYQNGLGRMIHDQTCRHAETIRSRPPVATPSLGLLAAAASPAPLAP